LLGHEDVVELLTETLEEESAADEKLTSISEQEILPAVSSAEGVAG
jgi:ferritin-like metal-binding protein YciE